MLSLCIGLIAVILLVAAWLTLRKRVARIRGRRIGTCAKDAAAGDRYVLVSMHIEKGEPPVPCGEERTPRRGYLLDFIRLAAIAPVFLLIFAGCVLAQPVPIDNNQPAPVGRALPKDAELIQNAALFFRTAQTTAAAITQTLDLVGKGIYVQGMKDGGIAVGVVALIGYLIVSRKDPPSPKP